MDGVRKDGCAQKKLLMSYEYIHQNSFTRGYRGGGLFFLGLPYPFVLLSMHMTPRG